MARANAPGAFLVVFFFFKFHDFNKRIFRD